MTIIALVAGEASGDQLGAALMHAIHSQHPSTRFAGIGGPKMQAAGLETWWDCAELSVMGLTEVIPQLPRLFRLRRALLKRLLELNADVFIGIDAPDFNLGIEKKLKHRSVPVIHYVSPGIWAWRAGRLKNIARSTDRVLCLFPFEPACYQHHDIAADYTGHPLADQIALHNDAEHARAAMKITASGPTIALLPGSRYREVEILAPALLDAADILTVKYPGCCFLLSSASPAIAGLLSIQLDSHPTLNCRLLSDRLTTLISAAQVVVCAAGTATLETMLVNRPMVVCYRMSGLTYWLVKAFRLLKSRFVALPNILAGEMLVPELLQRQLSAKNIAQQVSRWLDEPVLCSALAQRFHHLHLQLRRDAANRAASVVIQHISSGRAADS